MIERNRYLNKLISSKNNGFPKVITGIRRCGKSYLLSNIYKEYLINNGIKEEQILIINFNNDKYSELRDPILLGQFVREKCESKQENYVFIDEIQKVFTIVNPVLTGGKHILAKKDDTEVISFVDVILGLSLEKNIDLYVTGSNSKMLSKDVISDFRDKATNIDVYPLSFKEFYEYKKNNFYESINEYMTYGGLPLAVLKPEEEKQKYLETLFKTTYYRDILERNRINKHQTLNTLIKVLSSCSGQLINSFKISEFFKTIYKCDLNRYTIDSYLDCFIDSFIINEAYRYDIVGKKYIGALRKFYFTDCGLRNAINGFSKLDKGQMFENFIFNELILNGFEVSVGSFQKVEKDINGRSVRKDYEIDFLVSKYGHKFYLQVCNQLYDESVLEREIKPFLKLNDSVQKIVVVNEYVHKHQDDNGFIIIGVKEFLLEFIENYGKENL